jgi:hypothetical protein
MLTEPSFCGTKAKFIGLTYPYEGYLCVSLELCGTLKPPMTSLERHTGSMLLSSPRVLGTHFTAFSHPLCATSIHRQRVMVENLYCFHACAAIDPGVPTPWPLLYNHRHSSLLIRSDIVFKYT